MLALMVMKMMQVGNCNALFWSLLAPTMTFYFSTLEEYYTGGLFIGIGNAVTDGSAILIGMFIFAGVVGNSIFTTPIEFTLFGAQINMPFSHAFNLFILTT